jgi:hypothetical protein
MASAVNIPPPQIRAIDTTSGTFSREWWYWFQGIYSRTGGASGGSFGAAVSIVLTSSPFTYAPTQNGSILVSGPGVVRCEIIRDATSYVTGSWYGAFPLSIGDQFLIRYVGHPTVTFFPG